MYRLFTLFFSLLLFNNLNAQVTIAPTNMFLDSNSSFGTYMVVNGSNETQEVSVDFIFGYSITDEAGNRTMVQSDSNEVAQEYSIADRLRAFPRNFTLAPGQRQIVRLRLSNTSDLASGTYWSRIRTTSEKQSPPLELTNQEVVSAQIGIVIEQVTGLYFKNGDVSTGIDVQNIETNLDEENNLTVLTEFLRTGNSPFIGSVNVRLISGSGQIVREALVSTTYFFDGVHKQTFEVDDLPSGSYTVNIEFETRRDDVSANDLVQMNPVTESATVTIR
ncbi:MAG: hypothetical protein MI700_11690 [Balneolales bacterium]|nr:hypothetical protein [Balneolales bacterium]